mgnify:CR=1 FL=1
MYTATVVATVVLMFIGAVDYVRRAWKKETNPVPATWVLMVTTMGLSFWMYQMNPNKTWTGNIGVTAALLNTTIILVGVVALNVRHGTLKVAFDRVQRICMTGGFVIVLFWYFTNQPLIAYLLVQAIALFAYGATVRRLWRSERSTEPYFLWLSVLFGNFCAFYPAWVRNDVFSWIYLGRSTPSTLIIIWLIWRIKNRMHQK